MYILQVVSTNGGAAADQVAGDQVAETAGAAQDPAQQQQPPQNAWQVIKGVLFR